MYIKAGRSFLVSLPDDKAIRRAQRNFRRNLAEPGDCKGDIALLAGLAIAEVAIGRGEGWIPEVQRVGVKIAEMA